MDKFHSNQDRLYQVFQHNRYQDGVETDDFTPRMMGKELMAAHPEIESYVTVCEDWAETPGIASFGEKKFKAQDYQIDPEFFNIFSYQIIQGDRKNPVPNTKSVMVSDQIALKLFNSLDNVVGQTINWQQEEMSGNFVITGIFKAPGNNSSKQFDLLFSMELLEERHNNYSHWHSNNEKTYLLLKEGVDKAAFDEKIEGFLKTKVKGFRNTIVTQKFSEVYLNGNWENAELVGGRIVYVRLFGMVAIFILLIACINFMNLTTAKASNRMKEIGIKKAIGAKRGSLVNQYLSEAILLSVMGLVFAFGIAYLFLPTFNDITGKSLSLAPDGNLVLGALIITLVTGLLSGSYPALYLSGLHPIFMLKGKLQLTFGDTWLRKGLVVFQFAISTILISAVLIVSQQINYIQSKNLGFERSNLLRFDYVTEDGPGFRAFQEELKSIPEVEMVAAAVDDATGMHGGTSDVSWPGKPKNERIYFDILAVGYDFIETMGIELAAGRTYDVTRDEPGRSKMIFNQAAIDVMKIEDPIGKVVEVQGERTEIIGVAENFHFQSMYNSIHPLYIKLTDNLEYTLVKLNTNDFVTSLNAIEKVYDAHLGGVPFEFTFVDDDFQAMYKSELSIASLAKCFGILAVLISCLGLVGLTAFTAEKRTKEIGIRKVLGAGSWKIIYLLSSDFSKMVLIALIIGLPVSYFMAYSWIQNFAFGISIGLPQFILVGVATLSIAWLAVSLQTYKAARANPVTALRSE